jgi:hypothetical protein
MKPFQSLRERIRNMKPFLNMKLYKQKKHFLILDSFARILKCYFNFRPIFTNTPARNGTGLQGLVHRHGGRLFARRDPRGRLVRTRGEVTVLPAQVGPHLCRESTFSKLLAQWSLSVGRVNQNLCIHCLITFEVDRRTEM